MVTVAVFEDNADLRARLATKALPTREFIEVNIGDGYSKHTLFVHSLIIPVKDIFQNV